MFVGNSANQYLAFDGSNGFEFNGPVNFSNQVSGAGALASLNAVDAENQVNDLNAGNVSGLGNLATDNTSLGNLASNNTVSINNEVNGTGNLATANAVTASQVNDLANTTTIANNNSLGNLAVSNVTLGNIATLSNINAGTHVNAGLLDDDRLSTDNVTTQGNAGSLFSNDTTIDGGQITTGLISTQYLSLIHISEPTRPY